MTSKNFSIKFYVTEHDETGIKGAMPMVLKNAGWDSYIPGWMPAHDILEHGKGEFGALYQELQAFGAILFTRGWHVDEGYYAGECRSEMMGGEMCSAWRDSAWRDSFGRDLLAFPTFPKFSLSREDKEKFEEFFRSLKKSVRESWEVECEDEGENWFLENWDKVITAIKYGYYKAEKRWGSLYVYALFSRINDAMESAKNKIMDIYESYDPNVTFTLKCTVGEYGASANVVLPRQFDW